MCRSMSCSICTCGTGSCTTGRCRATAAGLSRYIARSNAPAVTSAYAKWPDDQKKAFWLNAYNALVLQTVVNNYPIQGDGADVSGEQHQADSWRVREDHARVAGKSVTLDQIENTVLAEFNDPRVYLALGRGAVGSGRLRSEAFSGKP